MKSLLVHLGIFASALMLFSTSVQAQQLRMEYGADEYTYSIHSYGNMIYLNIEREVDRTYSRFDTSFNHVWSRRNPDFSDNYYYRGATVDPSGNLVRSGTTDAYGTGDYDIILVSTSPTGDTLWTQLYSRPGDDMPTKIINIPGGFLVVGTTNSPGDGQDLALLKINTTGDTIFTKIYDMGTGSFVSNIGVDAVYDSDGTYYIMTMHYSGSSYDYVLSHFDANGNEITSWQYGTAVQDSPNRMVKAGDGSGMYIIGYTPAFSGTSQFLITKVDFSGNILWNKSITNFIDDPFITDALSLPTGDLILCGASSNPFSVTDNGFAARITPAGSILWSKVYGGYASTSFSSVALTDNGQLIFGGDYYDPSFISDIYMVKTDQNGDSHNCYQTDITCNMVNRVFTTITTPILTKSHTFNLIQPSVFKNNITPVITALDDFTISFNTINSECGAGCTGQATATPLGGSSPYNYNWSTGSTSSTVTNLCSGTYSLTIDDTYGCFVTDSVTISEQPPLHPVCFATVDSLTSTFNIVYWDSIVHPGVDSVIIHREVATNVYARVGAVDVPGVSYFEDFGANPNSTAYRYKLTIKDTCGDESSIDSCLYHNTIHLQYLGSGNFQWTLYDIESMPNPVVTYNIYRDDIPSGNFVSIGTVPGTQSTFTDIASGSFPSADYRVDVNWSLGCEPTTRAGVSTSRSNIRNKSVISTVKENESDEFKLQPNPTKDLITISSSTTIDEYILTDISGKIIASKSCNQTNLLLNLQEYQTGTYILLLRTSNGITAKHILKQ